MGDKLDEQTSEQNVYDDVFKSLISKCPQLLIPVINEVFKTDYTMQDQVIELREEQHFTDINQKRQKQIVDSYIQIRENRYHLECQSWPDRTMIFRMMNYDFQAALENRETLERGHVKIKYPESVVFYLRHGHQTPDQMTVEIEFPKGEKIDLTIPCVKVDRYGEDEIIQKNLLFFTPFYIMRYENQLAQIENDPILSEKLYREYEKLTQTIVQKEASGEMPLGYIGQIEEFNNLIINHVAKNHDTLRRELVQMGGSILRTRTDDLIDLGVAQGIDRGVDQERLRNIQKYMEKKMISFDEAYDYLKDTFDFPESQRESYRQKLADIKEAPKPKANKKTIKAMRR